MASAVPEAPLPDGAEDPLPFLLLRPDSGVAGPPLDGSRRTLPKFALHDQLFYLNALEWAASSVEVAAVAAKNVALLAYNRWYQDLDKIDQKDLIHKVKTEL